MCQPLRQVRFNHILIFCKQLPTSHFCRHLLGRFKSKRTHMKIIGETPLRVPPRAIVVPQAKNFRIVPERQIRRIVGTSRASSVHRADNLRPALTTQQIFQIARIFDPTVEDELAEGRAAWKNYQSTRKRDAVYEYLTTVFQIVVRWKEQRRAKAKSHQALKATGRRTIRHREPFTAVIVCTSDPRIVDPKTRSKWSRACRFAEQSMPNAENLAKFIKRLGGINECADQFSNRTR
jgi:hypothetical protein